MERLYEQIYRLVQRIPHGRVATYGQIAAMVGIPRRARQVGYALAALQRGEPRPAVPWHRVVNAQGRSSLGEEQMVRLRGEGVLCDDSGRINLRQFGWEGEMER